MEYIIEGKHLKFLVDMKLKELDNLLEEHVEYIELQEETNENGETYYQVQISDKTVSLTTIKCDKNGYDIHWGSSTPQHIKSIIENVMNGE